MRSVGVPGFQSGSNQVPMNFPCSYDALCRSLFVGEFSNTTSPVSSNQLNQGMEVGLLSRQHIIARNLKYLCTSLKMNSSSSPLVPIGCVWFPQVVDRNL